MKSDLMKERAFAHPALHLLNGERLYYLLLKIRSQIFGAGDRIRKSLEDSKLDQAACGYYVFGTNDVILRVWANEDKLNQFLEKVRQMPEILNDQIEVILTTRMLTWYQRELELSANWSNQLDEQNLDILLAGKSISESLSKTFDMPPQREKTTRFFIFFEQPYSAERSLFGELESKMRDPRDPLFKLIQHPSIYVYRTSRHKGVLLKGQMESFARSSHAIIELNEKLKEKEFDVRTVTYICSKPLKADGNDLISWNDAEPQQPRYGRIIYNLVKSHDCDRRTFSRVVGADHRHDSFLAILSKQFAKLCNWHSGWWDMISTLRSLYRWTVFNKDTQLIGFLMQQYVLIEKEFRVKIERSRALGISLGAVADPLEKRQEAMKVRCESLQEDLEAIEEVSSESINSQVTQKIGKARKKLDEIIAMCKVVQTQREITLGTIPQILSTALKSAPSFLADREKALIRELAAALQKCSADRNNLMHGEVTSLAGSHRDEKDYPWVPYVENYVNLALRLPHTKPALDRLLSNESVG